MAVAGRSAKSKVIKWPKILLLGDSQTQEGYGCGGGKESCWVSLISNHFQRKCDVVNRGFTGYNSRWVKMMLPLVVDADLARECAAVTLFLGSNDVNLKEFNPEHHVPLAEYKQSMIDITQYLLDLGISKEKMILIGPPPVDEELWRDSLVKDGCPAEHGMRNKVIKEYAVACSQASKELSVNCVDLYTEMMKHQDWRKFVNVDGIHLAKQGGEFLSQLLIERLQKVTESLPEIFPDYTVVGLDNDDPAHHFPTL